MCHRRSYRAYDAVAAQDRAGVRNFRKLACATEAGIVFLCRAMTDYSQASTFVQPQATKAEARAYAEQSQANRKAEQRIEASTLRPETSSDGGRASRDGDTAELSYRSVYAAAGVRSVDASPKADAGPRVLDVQAGANRQQTVDRLGQAMRQVIDGLK